MGVWIETAMCGLMVYVLFVTPCVGVWIETVAFICDDVERKSHPAWVCGLKPATSFTSSGISLSHPAWVCGLKPHCSRGRRRWPPSHPAWVCGLKQMSRLVRAVDGSHTLRGCVD